MAPRSCLFLSLAWFSACQCSSPRLKPAENPPLPEFDGGLLADSGTPLIDAGFDAGIVADAGRDAGVDAGLHIDAGLDAGSVIDAGLDAGAVIDAGQPDSGVPFDAGIVIDSGTPDAGGPCTAGTLRCNAGIAERCVADHFIKEPSALGCDFWPTILGYPLFGFFGGNTFAVTLSNPGTSMASAKIEGGMLTTPRQVLLAPGAISVEPLGEFNPRSPYHVTSTQPISVIQFNPLHAVSGGTNTYSSDSTLLRPVHHFGRTHVIASWPPYTTTPSMIGLSTTVPTRITITPKAAIPATALTPMLAAGIATTFALDAGVAVDLSSSNGDLTGSIVVADAPIQVLGGHMGTRIPSTIEAADRLEEIVPPIERLSTEYFVVSPALPAMPSGKPQSVRIIAAEPNVTMTYDPQLPGAPTQLAAIGDVIDLAPQSTVYRVSATGKVLVAQYMQSNGAGGSLGDPSMLLPLPREQWLSRYVFHAPVDYPANAIDVVAPTGSTVVLDGAPLSGWQPIGATGFSYTRVTSLGSGTGATGHHDIQSSVPFLLLISGNGEYVSYWHAG